MSNININNLTPLGGASGKVSISGSLHVKNNITYGGDLQLGDASTDSINFVGEVSSSIIPDVTNTYNIGSSAQSWNSGSFAYISASGNIIGANITASSGISVGSSVIGDTISTTNITASGNISASGTIIADDAIIGSGTVTIDGDNGHITASGNISASGTIEGLSASFGSVKIDKNEGGLFIGKTGANSFSMTASQALLVSAYNYGGATDQPTPPFGAGNDFAATFMGNISSSGHICTKMSVFSSDSDENFVAHSNNSDFIHDILALTTGSSDYNNNTVTTKVGVISQLGEKQLRIGYNDYWRRLWIGSSGVTLPSIYLVGNITSSEHITAPSMSIGWPNASADPIIPFTPKHALVVRGNISASGTLGTAQGATIFAESGSFKHIEGVTNINATTGIFGTGTTTIDDNVLSTGFIQARTYVSASGGYFTGNITASNESSFVGIAKTKGNISASGEVMGRTGSFEKMVIGGKHVGANLEQLTSSLAASHSLLIPSNGPSVDGENMSHHKITTVVATGGAETSQLTAGTEGQIKIIVMKTDGGDMVTTVTNAGWKSSGTGTITFDTIGDSCTLMYISGKWFVIGNNGGAFA